MANLVFYKNCFLRPDNRYGFATKAGHFLYINSLEKITVYDVDAYPTDRFNLPFSVLAPDDSIAYDFLLNIPNYCMFQDGAENLFYFVEAAERAGGGGRDQQTGENRTYANYVLNFKLDTWATFAPESNLQNPAAKDPWSFLFGTIETTNDYTSGEVGLIEEPIFDEIFPNLPTRDTRYLVIAEGYNYSAESASAGADARVNITPRMYTSRISDSDPGNVTVALFAMNERAKYFKTLDGKKCSDGTYLSITGIYAIPAFDRLSLPFIIQDGWSDSNLLIQSVAILDPDTKGTTGLWYVDRGFINKKIENAGDQFCAGFGTIRNKIDLSNFYENFQLAYGQSHLKFSATILGGGKITDITDDLKIEFNFDPTDRLTAEQRAASFRLQNTLLFTDVALGAATGAGRIIAGDVVGGASSLVGTATNAISGIIKQVSADKNQIFRTATDAGASSVLPFTASVTPFTGTPLNKSSVLSTLSLYGFSTRQTINAIPPFAKLVSGADCNALYLQFSDVHISANIPETYKKEIENILINGIRVFKSYPNDLTKYNVFDIQTL